MRHPVFRIVEEPPDVRAGFRMTRCLHCTAELSPGARFCAECGRPAAVDAPGASVKVEINRNRVYMKDRSGLVEFRLTNLQEAAPLAVSFTLDSSPAGLLGEGGETQIRGVNIRTVGPVDSFNRALGGNKYALFNAEYYFDLFGPLRFLLFYDAGQAFLEEEPIDITEFRTSTGVELRFFMPVINVPFRLIYAWNPQRDPFQDKSTFKFAVGTTF